MLRRVSLVLCLFGVLAVSTACVSKVPIRVAKQDKVGLAVSLGMPKLSGEQDLTEFVVQETSKFPVIKESEVRAELAAVDKDDEDRIVGTIQSTMKNGTSKKLGWPKLVDDPGCATSGLRYCLQIYSQLFIHWTGGLASGLMGGDKGSWNVSVQTTGAVVQTSDQATVWRHLEQVQDNISGSSADNPPKPFMTMFEKLAREGTEKLIVDLERTIEEREAAAAAAP